MFSFDNTPPTPALDSSRISYRAMTRLQRSFKLCLEGIEGCCPTSLECTSPTVTASPLATPSTSSSSSHSHRGSLLPTADIYPMEPKRRKTEKTGQSSTCSAGTRGAPLPPPRSSSKSLRRVNHDPFKTPHPLLPDCESSSQGACSSPPFEFHSPSLSPLLLSDLDLCPLSSPVVRSRLQFITDDGTFGHKRQDRKPIFEHHQKVYHSSV